jgi:hypothetical protein
MLAVKPMLGRIWLCINGVKLSLFRLIPAIQAGISNSLLMNWISPERDFGLAQDAMASTDHPHHLKAP